MSESQFNSKPEFILCELNWNYKKILLGVVYRPPKIGFMAEFFNYVESIILNYNDVIIVGDFNANMSSNPLNSYAEKLINLTKGIGLKMLPFKPTFHRGSCESTFDLKFTNSNCSM